MDKLHSRKSKKSGGLATFGIGKEWQRVKRVLFNTYEDIEDREMSNEGMMLGSGFHDIKVCTWNANGLSDLKLELTLIYMRQNKIDVMFINDTRYDGLASDIAKRKIKGYFEGEYFVSAAPVTPMAGCRPVGGQLVVVAPPWKTYVSDVWTDTLGLGGILLIKIKTRTSFLICANMYVPVRPVAEGHPLWRRYEILLAARSFHEDPLSYLRRALMSKLSGYADKGYPVILMGDMNATWKNSDRGGCHSNLKDWAVSNGWNNQICDLCDKHGVALVTYLRQSTWIDHIMTCCDSTLLLRYFGVGSGSVWRESNDHTPLWASYSISSGGLPQQVDRSMVKKNTALSKLPPW